MRVAGYSHSHNLLNTSSVYVQDGNKNSTITNASCSMMKIARIIAINIILLAMRP